MHLDLTTAGTIDVIAAGISVTGIVSWDVTRPCPGGSEALGVVRHPAGDSVDRSFVPCVDCELIGRPTLEAAALAVAERIAQLDARSRS